LIFFNGYDRVSPGFRLLFACSYEQAKPLNSDFTKACEPTFAYVLKSAAKGKFLPLPKMKLSAAARISYISMHCGFPHQPPKLV